MRLTNKLNLPQPIVDAVANDEYSRGDADLSVTQLVDSPRVRVLMNRHEHEITEDASSRIFSLFGQVMHTILERANRTGIAERRLSVTIEGLKVSGAMDLVEIDSVLSDYKVINVAKVNDPEKRRQYERQLNCYAHMLRAHGEAVKGVQVVAILRDWYKAQAMRDPLYPQTQVIVISLPLWTPDEAEKYMRERVILHKQAEISLPLCSAEDRWAKPMQWALMKKGGKRAVKLYLNESDARAHASSDPKLLSVEVRPGGSVRCNYCALTKHCDQYKAEQAGDQSQAKDESEVLSEVS